MYCSNFHSIWMCFEGAGYREFPPRHCNTDVFLFLASIGVSESAAVPTRGKNKNPMDECNDCIPDAEEV